MTLHDTAVHTCLQKTQNTAPAAAQAHPHARHSRPHGIGSGAHGSGGAFAARTPTAAVAASGGSSSSSRASSRSGALSPAASRRLLGLGLPRGGLGLAAALENSTRAYEALAPVADVVDVRRAWRAAGLPPPPAVLCHVGLLGWHCHNTTMNPWNPKSLLPKAATPPMPENATCVICPRGWKGGRGNLAAMLFDLPTYVKAKGRALPPGMWDGERLMAEARAREAAGGKAAAAGRAPAAASEDDGGDGR